MVSSAILDLTKHLPDNFPAYPTDHPVKFIALGDEAVNALRSYAGGVPPHPGIISYLAIVTDLTSEAGSPAIQRLVIPEEIFRSISEGISDDDALYPLLETAIGIETHFAVIISSMPKSPHDYAEAVAQYCRNLGAEVSIIRLAPPGIITTLTQAN